MTITTAVPCPDHYPGKYRNQVRGSAITTPSTLFYVRVIEINSMLKPGD